MRVIPLWNGNGTVKVVIVDSDNQPAGEDLIEAVKSHIEEQRPIGAEVTVVSATALTINITVSIIADGSDGIQDAVEESIKGYLADEALKKSYVSYAKVGSFILSVAGVEDYSNLKINNGTNNITISDGSVPVLGSVVFT